MDLKISQVIDFHSAYSKLKDQDMSIKLAYRLNQIEDICEKKVVFYETKMRDIIEKYSEKDEDGRPALSEDKVSIKIQPDFIQKCTEQIQELSELDVEIPDIKFTLDQLGELKLSVAEVKALMPFISEED